MLRNFIFQTEREEKETVKQEIKKLRDVLFRQEQIIKKRNCRYWS